MARIKAQSGWWHTGVPESSSSSSLGLRGGLTEALRFAPVPRPVGLILSTIGLEEVPGVSAVVNGVVVPLVTVIGSVSERMVEGLPTRLLGKPGDPLDMISSAFSDLVLPFAADARVFRLVEVERSSPGAPSFSIVEVLDSKLPEEPTADLACGL